MKLLYILCAAALLASARANAVPVLVGEIAPSNASAATEHVSIRTAIDEYDAGNPNLSQLFGVGSDPGLINGWSVFLARTGDVLSFGDHTIAYTAPASFSEYYVFSRYGLGGADFSSAVHYMNAGEVLSYNPGGAAAPQGLGAVAIWARGPADVSNVPDGGQTAALLGLSLIALVLFRRRVLS